MLLSNLKEKEKAIVLNIKGHGSFKKRLSEMGFIKGKVVEVIKHAPLKDPIEYRIMNYNVSLRKKEAQLINVINIDEYIEEESITYSNLIKENITTTEFAKRKDKTIHVALVGNPNAGKTTFFNHASGSSERVGNYSGVTVSVKKASFKHKDYKIEIADLPGTYSLSSFTPEERYVRNYILSEKPDIIINLTDASNLERNMLLTSQLIDMDLRVVMALNMYDELKKTGASLDYEQLGILLGIPIVPTVSSKGKGIKKLLEKIIDIYEDNEPTIRHVHINYGEDIEKSIQILQKIIMEDAELTAYASPRFLSLKCLQDDQTITAFAESPIYKKIEEESSKQRKTIEQNYKNDIDTILTDAHYGFISGALRECYKESKEESHKKTRILDNFLTNRFLGFPIFILFMYITFYATFNLGSYPMEWIESGISFLSEYIQSTMPNGFLKDLLIDGIIGGVGGVLVFLPNILILFLFISLMEDSGYMARTVFIMDKLMHKIGLHGRSFIPLVMGFGCNVPAIMATRTLNNRKDRMITMLINPFISCSARLPVYILLIGAFFPKNETIILLSIYLIGILLAIVMARIFRKTLFRSADVPFVMELPPYRIPTIRSLLKHMWSKGVHYIKKISGVILIASTIIWALGYFPRDIEYSKNYDLLRKQTIEKYNTLQKDNITNVEKKILKTTLDKEIKFLNYTKEEERLQKTYIGRIGKTIEPILKPLGFDWKIGVAIVTGAAAKEVVVSTLGVLYEEGGETNEESVLLKNKLKSAKYTKGEKKGEFIYSPIVAFSLMLFVLIYFPCIGVLAVVAKESGWKWALFLAIYTTLLAYFFAMMFYQISSIFA